MNTVAIVNDFAHTVEDDKRKLIADMAELMQEVISRTKRVDPKDASGNERYEALRDTSRRVVMVQCRPTEVTGLSTNEVHEQRLIAAAKFLFNSCD